MTMATEANKPMVDLNALEEERFRMEEKILGFTIFSKREGLDAIEDELLNDPNHHEDHPIGNLHAEANENDEYIDSLHENWKNIAAELEKEEDDEDDNPDELEGEEKQHKDEEEHRDEEKIHESLKAMVQEHSGEDSVAEKHEEEEEENSDSDDEEEGGLKIQMPDFSQFNMQLSKQGMCLPGTSNSDGTQEETGEEMTFSFAAVQEEREKTAAKKGKRASGQSQLENILNGGGKPSCRRKRPLRSKSAPLTPVSKPLREGEEEHFFDWKLFAKVQKRKQVSADVSNLTDQENPESETLFSKKEGVTSDTVTSKNEDTGRDNLAANETGVPAKETNNNVEIA